MAPQGPCWTKTGQRLLVLLVILCLVDLTPLSRGPVAQAQTAKLDDLEEKIKTSSRKAEQLTQESQEISAEISGLQKELITLATEMQQRESLASEIEQRLMVLEQERHVLENRLIERRDQMSTAIGAMQKLSQQPPALVFLKPEESLASIRTSVVFNQILPPLRDEARRINLDIERLRDVKTQITEEQSDLNAELNELASAKESMGLLVNARQQKQQELLQASAKERQRLAQYAREAKNLKELIARLEEESRRREKAALDAARRLAVKPNLDTQQPHSKSVQTQLPKGSSPFSTARGTLPLPAAGRLISSFGQSMPTGQTSRGITLRTRQNAQVVAPYDGRIVFAGPFRTYGQLLIIAHGEGYHTLLAGLDQVYGVVGQWVLKGEPIAQMGISVKDQGDGLRESPPQLYVELRRMGKPINPLPWLAARDRKVLG